MKAAAKAYKAYVAKASVSSVIVRSLVLQGSILIAVGMLCAQILAVHVPMPPVLVESALFPAAFIAAVMGWASVRPPDAALVSPHNRK